MAQTFLHAGEHGLVVTGLDVNHAIRRKAGLGERGGKEVRSGDAPKDFALGAGSYSRREQRGSGTVDGTVAAACNLVKGSDSEPIARKARVNLGDPERENRSCASFPAFDLGDLRT